MIYDVLREKYITVSLQKSEAEILPPLHSLTCFQKGSVVPFAPPSVVPGTKYSPPSKLSSVNAAGNNLTRNENIINSHQHFCLTD